MRKNAIWYIPCAFFLVACVLNLIGCIQGTDLSDTVKPALLPLLSATTLAFLLGRDVPDYRQVGLLVTAQLLGCTGDVLLIPDNFAFFVAGIAAFLVGHLFYMCLFGGLSWKGLNVWQWILSFFAMVAIVLGLVKVIGIEGPLFWPMLRFFRFLHRDGHLRGDDLPSAPLRGHDHLPGRAVLAGGRGNSSHSGEIVIPCSSGRCRSSRGRR